MGKGSKQPQEQTVVQSNLPKYVRPLRASVATHRGRVKDWRMTHTKVKG